MASGGADTTDIWRYSDWWGLGPRSNLAEAHLVLPRSIIESINLDKGYDQMLREMLAADELYPDDLDKLRASGFLARQYFKFNRTTWMDETIEHTAKAMLGLTFNCAKCHDHKYDPLTQLEYYRLRAIFEPYQIRPIWSPASFDLEKDGIPRAFDCNLEAKTFLHIRGDERRPDEGRLIEPGFPTFLTPVVAKIEPVALSAEASNRVSDRSSWKPISRPPTDESLRLEWPSKPPAEARPRSSEREGPDHRGS